MTASQEELALLELVERIEPGSRLLGAWRMTGGVSAQTTAIEVERPDGRMLKMIVRQHGEIDRSRNPHIARDEFRLLGIARARGLLAPQPVFLDETCDLFPVPIVVVEFIEGDSDSTPEDMAAYLAQTASELARIHGVRDSPELSFLPRQNRGFGTRPDILDASMREGSIRDALESDWPLNQINPAVLLHGDFWPGNLLWSEGKLVAVIDWEDARVGDPLADLGNSRLEILWAFGVEAMREFTSRYHSVTDTDITNLPCWDLCAALRPCSRIGTWGLDPGTESRMREQHELFVDQALGRLSGR
jgi:aminoglycoside phosphotransferase (APT) family kinase protein